MSERYRKPADPMRATGAAGIREESTVELLAVLLPAVAHRLRGSIPLWVANRGISVFGIVLLLSPAALWVAWSATVLYVVLGAVAVSFIGIMVLLWLGPGDHY